MEPSSPTLYFHHWNPPQLHTTPEAPAGYGTQSFDLTHWMPSGPVDVEEGASSLSQSSFEINNSASWSLYDYPVTRSLSRQNSGSSLGSQYSRFEESSTLLGRGQRLDSAYQCTQCSANFNVPSDLRQHERKHIPKQQLPYHCGFAECGERFLYPKDLRRHTERKHRPVPRLGCLNCSKLKVRCDGDGTQPCNKCTSRRLPCVQRDAHSTTTFTCTVCGRRLRRLEHLKRHMKALHGMKLPKDPNPPESAASVQLSASSQSPTPDLYCDDSRQSLASDAFERDNQPDLDISLRTLQEKVPGLVDSQGSEANADTLAPDLDHVMVLTKAVDRMTELEGNVDDLAFINKILALRLQEHERLRANLQPAMMTANDRNAGVHEESYPADSVLSKTQSTRAELPHTTGQDNVWKKRKANESPEVENDALVTCECLACGFDMECPRIQVLMKQKAELESELERVRADGITWLDERNKLLKLLHEDNGDQEQLTLRSAGDAVKPLSNYKMSVSRRAKAWLATIGILVRGNKKAFGEEHEYTDRALDQLSRDVERLELPESQTTR